MNLIRRFRRPVPHHEPYISRLHDELALIKRFGFEECFNRASDIVDMMDGAIHIVRGSASCSLVSYLLGISNIDPVSHGISVARFMNKTRTDLPDIDLDVPYNLRDDILRRVYNKWPGKVARISNIIRYRQKSATRQALRILGLPSNITRTAHIARLYPNKVDLIRQTSNRLLGHEAHVSLHCGGLVFFDDGIPNELKVNDYQVKLDKRDVEKQRLLKIDILCNRGLAQLMDLDPIRQLHDYPEDDNNIIELLSNGDVMGLTFAESPTFTRAVRSIKPTNRKELALALGLIRPAAASKGRKRLFIRQWQNRRRSSQLVFEDDVLASMTERLGISVDEADRYRKGFAGSKNDVINEFMKRFGQRDDINDMIDSYSQFRYYSFCHSHALVYAHLVWALAYHKIYNPKKFWETTLNHCNSMYRRWVHVYHALHAGLKIDLDHPKWRLYGSELKKEAFQRDLFGRTQCEEYFDYGFWTNKEYFPTTAYTEANNQCQFKGMIACSRIHGDTTFITISVKPLEYIDLIIDKRLDVSNHHKIEGNGEVVRDDSGVLSVLVRGFKLLDLSM
jgi:error-prone DNA polymerase